MPRSYLFYLLPLFLLGCNQEPPEYAIVYKVLVDEASDNYDLVIMGLDGSDKTILAQAPGVEWTYTTKNQSIFFISDRGATHREYYLYSLNVRNGSIKQVSNLRLADSWQSIRANGDMVVKLYDNFSQFHILNSSGEIINTIETGLPYASDPCFSPDGEMIAFRGGQAARYLAILMNHYT